MSRKEDNTRVVARNRRAKFDYHLELKVVAGIALVGTEVKSLREGRSSLDQAYARIDDDEVWLVGANIPEYPGASWGGHKPQARRKLLLKRREIKKLKNLLQSSGKTLIPLDIHFNERGFAKVTLAVATGKKHFDKRESKKEQDARREIDRAMKRRS